MEVCLRPRGFWSKIYPQVCRSEGGCLGLPHSRSLHRTEMHDADRTLWGMVMGTPAFALWHWGRHEQFQNQGWVSWSPGGIPNRHRHSPAWVAGVSWAYRQGWNGLHFTELSKSPSCCPFSGLRGVLAAGCRELHGLWTCSCGRWPYLCHLVAVLSPLALQGGALIEHLQRTGKYIFIAEHKG